MRLTVLGCSPASANPGGASSSYLVEHEETRVLLDCGSGSLGNLVARVAPEDLDAVVISHMHADHVLDLIPFRYALAFAAKRYDPAQTGRPTLYLPPGGHAKMLGISRLQDPSDEFFSSVCPVVEYDPAAPLVVGGLTLTFTPVVHIPHTYAIRVARDGGALTYSSDTGPCPSIYDAARNAGLFLCECSRLESDDYPYHLTASQAGEIAAAAEVGRLVLVHRWYRHGLEEAREWAARFFHGPIEVAREGASWEV